MADEPIQKTASRSHRVADPLAIDLMADNRLLQQAIQLDRDGQWPRACELYRQFVAANPTRADVLAMLARALVQLGETGEAIDCYTQAVRIEPNSAELHNNLGALLADAGRHDEAERYYPNALRIDPHYAAAHYNRGNLFEVRGQPGPGHRLLPRGFGALCPILPKPIATWASYCAKTAFEEALPWLERANRLRPDWFLVVTNLGGALQGLGRFEEAQRYLARAAQIDPCNPTAYVNLGILLNELNARRRHSARSIGPSNCLPTSTKPTSVRATALLNMGDFRQGWAELRISGRGQSGRHAAPPTAAVGRLAARQVAPCFSNRNRVWATPCSSFVTCPWFASAAKGSSWQCSRHSFRCCALRGSRIWWRPMRRCPRSTSIAPLMSLPLHSRHDARYRPV